MNFYSTRDRERKQACTLREAAMMGLAPDGGLFVPERIPQADLDEAERLAGESYAALAGYLAGLFFGDDLDTEALRRELATLYDYPVPLRRVGRGRYTLELFHGPTCAFKDFGAGFMGRAVGLLGAAGERLVILTATSGDTGSAVAHGFYNVPGVDVVVLYPEGKISRLQECQMTALGGNIHPLRVAGTFDDCQRLVKELFADESFRRRRRVTSANSINLLRWIPQAFYYFYGYFSWRRETGGESPTVVVPSGNFGNLAAGMLAQRMGLPVGGFVAASNLNDVVPEFLRTGVYRPRPSVQTPASAMDVGAPSNFERMLWLCGGDPERLRSELEGFRCDNAGIRRTIDELYERYGYFSDPHSAVGYAASMAVGKPGFYLSTAHPAKFGEVIASVTGSRVPLPDRLSVLTQRPQHSDPLAVDLAALEDFVAEV
ncbi:MAG TPA: threonine synthase [Candidatus Alistipes cottocaccae]|nr:threonine synthase [Candidatus Alistipes cottocaccae]